MAKAHEPRFAPHSSKDENGNMVFPDFGEWFDEKNKIKIAHNAPNLRKISRFGGL